MSRLPGRSASHIWFSKDFDFKTPNRVHDIPSSQTEKKRINFLRSLALEMSKLKEIPFNGIGMPCLGYIETDPKSLAPGFSVDSTFVYTSDNDPKSVQEYTACYSTQNYTCRAIDKWQSETEPHYGDGSKALSSSAVPDDYSCQHFGACKLLDMIFAHPVFQSNREDSFFLQHDDLDLQNILVDDDGNVTGLIDWDGSVTMPRCVAHAASPNFLRRDWFPSHNGTSAHLYFRMEHYREVYAAAMVEAGDPDALYTTKSGLYQAAFVAIHEYKGGCKYDLIEKLCRRVPHITKDAIDFTTALGNPSVCWQLEDMIKTELYKILDPELPRINLQELVWDVAARAFMAEFETFLMPPTFEELAEAWKAGFLECFELE